MGKPFGKQPHEYRKWHKTINMDIWEKGWREMNGTNLVQDRAKWQVFFFLVILKLLVLDYDTKALI
jgi:hypothetical protein